jgi:RNA polymerase sigma factor (sigma-70 family)
MKNSLSKEEEVALFTAYKEGDENAKLQIIDANINFVISAAKKRVTNSINLDDLIVAGRTGLIEAIDSFDISKGYQFITYAAVLIEREITDYLMNVLDVKLDAYAEKYG